MSGVLKYTVVVRHPETLQAVPLLAGGSVPAWASSLVHVDDLDGVPQEASSAKADGQPAGNASREEWVAFAMRQGAPASETAPVEDDGASRNDLRDKYGK